MPFKPQSTLIVLAGPTASGKTQLAIELAQHFHTEIISADSRQFYREIPIGTAAPTPEQLKAVPHHFIGNLSVTDDYNVSTYEKEVLELLKKKFISNPVMIMTGGSGLYINAVCKGIDDIPNPDKSLRNELNQLFLEKGIETLRSKLKAIDPEYYSVVDHNNPKRLLRALEVCLQTGEKYSKLRKNKDSQRPFNIIKVGLEVPREILNERINKRADEMIRLGWIQEAESVIRYKDYNALNTVGFKELFNYLEGKWTLEYAVEKIKTNTRRYAKRQMTWFRKDTDITWFSPGNIKTIISQLDGKLNQQNI